MSNKEQPQVIVQYVTKYDGPAAPTCAEMILLVILLIGLAIVFSLAQ